MTNSPTGLRKRPKGMKGFVWEYIIDRLDRLHGGEDLQQILTSDVWYDLVDETKDSKWNGTLAKYYISKYGYSIKSEKAAKHRTRESIISYIKDVCDDLDIRRADVNILAGDVGYLFFRGERYPISLDELDELRLKGTDVLIIEKQGSAEVLKDFANPYGIALLSTRGFLTENALDLSAFSESSGANVAILTDFDISGVVIAHKVPDVPRIGIDFGTLEDLGIRGALGGGEYYTPDKGHLKYAKNNMPNLKDLKFLETSRIEINAVKNKVGSEGLWNWILGKLEEIYPSRDYYSRAALDIPKPYYFRPPELDKVNTLIDTRIGRILQPEIDRCRHELCNYQGFIEDVSDYEQDLYEQFEYVLNNNNNGNGNGNGRIRGALNKKDSDVSTSTSTVAAAASAGDGKDFLKNVRKDLAKFLKKYDGGADA